MWEELGRGDQRIGFFLGSHGGLDLGEQGCGAVSRKRWSERGWDWYDFLWGWGGVRVEECGEGGRHLWGCGWSVYLTELKRGEESSL